MGIFHKIKLYSLLFAIRTAMSTALVWFRYDLRCNNNPALSQACNNHDIVIPIYIYDEHNTSLGAAQHWWLHHSLRSLQSGLNQYGLPLVLRRGDTVSQLNRIIQEHHVDSVYWNRCYEPAIIQRDTLIKAALKQQGIGVYSSNASLLNEPWTIKNKNGDYFKVFTPFWKQCLKQMIPPPISTISARPAATEVPSDNIDHWNLLPTHPNWASAFGDHWEPGETGAQNNLNRFIRNALNGYKTQRNQPANAATSKLSPHLHFGEISPWQLYQAIETAKLERTCELQSADHFLSELGWREFSYYLLYHFPTLPNTNFKSAFNAYPWEVNPSALKRWQTGMTGFPIVDAGMRELWQTGNMHNRVRMIVASFLTKDLLIDWQVGASWFMHTLLDADLANNSASWQWVAGCGVDAAPYFRIFNPVLQGETHDPHGDYVKRWVPELAGVSKKWIHQPWEAPYNEIKITLGKDYPHPMVNHNTARLRALKNYQTLKNSSENT
jgi:deoxyribodipyrimidine photo-lyase